MRVAKCIHRLSDDYWNHAFQYSLLDEYWNERFMIFREEPVDGRGSSNSDNTEASTARW